MIDLVHAISDLDQRPDLHAARLLVLLAAFADEDNGGSVEGLTKLAKLDFLLRYPNMLERALTAKKRSTAEVKLEEHERYSVESQMVRYRFGPWDHRYREFLNILVGKGLASIRIDGRTIVVSITEMGKDCAQQIAAESIFEPYARRARVLKRHLDMTATNLMRFIYETFPEILSYRANVPITQ